MNDSVGIGRRGIARISGGVTGAGVPGAAIGLAIRLHPRRPTPNFRSLELPRPLFYMALGGPSRPGGGRGGSLRPV